MSVHHGDWHHFHACVGEKALICRINRLGPEMSFVNGDLCPLREAEHNITRDPIKQATCKRRGAEPASLDEKKVADGAFRQMRFPIEQDTVEGAGCDRFPFGQDIVQEICGLDLGRESAGQVPSRSGDDQAHAGLVPLGRRGLKRFGHDDDSGSWAEGRIQADVADSSRNGNTKVCVSAFVSYVIPTHGLMEEPRPPLFGNGDGQADRVRRPSKPVEMLVPQEDPAPIGANRFIDAIAVKKPMIEDGDDGLFFFHKPIVEKNPHRYVCCSALKNAWAFWSVSSYSLAGSESATIPAPTCKYPFPAHHTKVRITILRSRSPFQPM